MDLCRKYNIFSKLGLLTLIIAVGASMSVLGQGKGRNGGQKGNGSVQGKGRGGQPKVNRTGPPVQNQKQKHQQQRPQSQVQGGRRQQHQRAEAQPNPGRAMKRGKANGRVRIEQRGRRAQALSFEPQRKSQGRRSINKYQDPPEYSRQRGKKAVQHGRQKAGRGRNSYPAPGLYGPPLRKPISKNYGNERSSEVHVRSAERKASKRYLKDSNISIDTFRHRRDIPRWHDSAVRSVVASSLTNTFDGPYYSASNWNRAYSGSYYPDPYVGGYYDDYQPYLGYSGTVSYYNFYTPCDQVYRPNYGAATYCPSYYVDTVGLPYYEAANIGLPQLTVSSSVGGFVSDYYGDLIAFGYDQGYRDALYARSHGYRTTRIVDPYDPYVYAGNEVIFEDIGYDPYSCFGERRRYASEGYESGYRDALYGENRPDLYLDNTSVDLVSILMAAAFTFS